MTPEIGRIYVIQSQAGVAAAVIAANTQREISLIEKIQQTGATIYERQAIRIKFNTVGGSK